MFAKVNSFGVRGLAGFAVTAEADISGGAPPLFNVGLPGRGGKEGAARGRRRAKKTGFAWATQR